MWIIGNFLFEGFCLGIEAFSIGFLDELSLSGRAFIFLIFDWALLNFWSSFFNELLQK
jgi:hypothetical protein